MSKSEKLHKKKTSPDEWCRMFLMRKQTPNKWGCFMWSNISFLDYFQVLDGIKIMSDTVSHRNQSLFELRKMEV